VLWPTGCGCVLSSEFSTYQPSSSRGASTLKGPREPPGRRIPTGPRWGGDSRPARRLPGGEPADAVGRPETIDEPGGVAARRPHPMGLGDLILRINRRLSSTSCSSSPFDLRPGSSFGLPIAGPGPRAGRRRRRRTRSARRSPGALRRSRAGAKPDFRSTNSQRREAGSRPIGNRPSWIPRWTPGYSAAISEVARAHLWSISTAEGVRWSPALDLHEPALRPEEGAEVAHELPGGRRAAADRPRLPRNPGVSQAFGESPDATPGASGPRAPGRSTTPMASCRWR